MLGEKGFIDLRILMVRHVSISGVRVTDVSTFEECDSSNRPHVYTVLYNVFI